MTALRTLTACSAALLACCIFLAQTETAVGVELPVLTGRVVDNAGIIDAEKELQLTRTLADFEADSTDQVVVVTLSSLEGEALEPFANRLFRHWQLGQAEEDNGVLLLVVNEDRRIRIEVGYGLEGSLTDLHSRLIIDNTIVPAFRQGDYGGGIVRAVDDMIAVLSGDTAELEARARRNDDSRGQFPSWPIVTFLVIWFLFMFGSVLIMLLARAFGRKIGPGRYEWRGITVSTTGSGRRRGGSPRGGFSGSSGFSGGGGSSGGGGASGSW